MKLCVVAQQGRALLIACPSPVEARLYFCLLLLAVRMPSGTEACWVPWGDSYVSDTRSESLWLRLGGCVLAARAAERSSPLVRRRDNTFRQRGHGEPAKPRWLTESGPSLSSHAPRHSQAGLGILAVRRKSS